MSDSPAKLKQKGFFYWFSSGRFLHGGPLAAALWFGLSGYTALFESLRNHYNNYTIFKYVLIHSREQVNLYLHYPAQYQDINLYGPFFALVIAPFAMLPDKLGVILWVMAGAAFLWYAVRQLPVDRKWQTAILLLSSHELMNASSWLQSNQLTCACIILGFCFILRGRDGWAAFFICFAGFIKIYGFAGFAFFFFSQHRVRLILWSIGWSLLFFFLPMILSSPHFVLQSYLDWKECLVAKDIQNKRLDIQNDFQDISAMGFIRRVFYRGLNDLAVVIPAFILFTSQYVQVKFFRDLRFQLYLLCSALLFVVIFSSGAESPTYIIAFPAVCLWFVLQPSSPWARAMLIFALILTSFSYSDLLTPWFRNNVVRPYSLKALPCIVMWLVIIFQIHTRQFLKASAHQPLRNG